MIWIVFRSQTQAIQCRNFLAKNGIIGHVGKPPRTQKRDACTWAVGIEWGEKSKAQQLLYGYGIRPCKWVDAEGGVV